MYYNRHIVLYCQTFKAFTKGDSCIFYLFKDSWISLQNRKRCKTRCNSNRVTAQCTGLVNRTSWRNLVHNLTITAKYSKWHATANDFTKACKVRFDVITFLCTPTASAEATHNFVKDQHCAMSLSHFSQGFQEAWFWRHTAHITCYRFYDNSRNSIADFVE